MVNKSRSKTTRSLVKSNNSISRQTRFSRSSASKTLSPHSFTRFTNPVSIGKSTSDVGQGFTVSLADLSNSTEFTNLFDEYIITRVTAFITVTGINTPGGTYPIIYLYTDNDDSNAPASLNIALQVDPIRIVPFSASQPFIKHSFTPLVSLTAGGSGAMSARGWCDIAYPSIPWYGLKMWIQNYNTNVYTGTFIQIMFKVECQFRGVR